MFLKNYYYYFKEALTSEFCDKIIQHGKTQVLEEAKIADEKQKARNSSVAWLQDLWLYETIEPFIQQANVQAGWNYDWIASESCQFTIYKETQYYHWHQDSHSEPYNRPGSGEDGMIRKLSVTISLEDSDNYEGGDLEFCINHPEKEEVFAFIDKVKGVTKDSIKLAKRRRGVKLSGNELYQHILDNYITPVMDETHIDNFTDDFHYYDNVICWGIENYLESEEPEREDDYDYRNELEENIKDWWQPV